MSKSDKNTIELYFEWWLLEMKSAGYIADFKREPEKLLVLDNAPYGRYKRFKSKEKEIEEFNLFQKIQYTYDYRVIWNDTAEYLFYEEVLPAGVFQFGIPPFIAHRSPEGDVYSLIDVKPTNSVMQKGGNVSSSISFPLKQRMLWDRDRLYINKVVPMPMAGTGFNSALFIKTFCPQRYFLTDGGGQRRKIKWKAIPLKEYVKNKITYIDNLLKNTK